MRICTRLAVRCLSPPLWPETSNPAIRQQHVPVYISDSERGTKARAGERLSCFDVMRYKGDPVSRVSNRLLSRMQVTSSFCIEAGSDDIDRVFNGFLGCIFGRGRPRVHNLYEQASQSSVASVMSDFAESKYGIKPESGPWAISIVRMLLSLHEGDKLF